MKVTGRVLFDERDLLGGGHRKVGIGGRPRLPE